MTKQDDAVWEEMARRYVQFSPERLKDDALPEHYRCWVLFYKSDIRRQILNGDLVPSFPLVGWNSRTTQKLYNSIPNRQPNWYRPSESAWIDYIKPLVEKYRAQPEET